MKFMEGAFFNDFFDTPPRNQFEEAWASTTSKTRAEVTPIIQLFCLHSKIKEKMVVFMIVGKGEPLYEAELGSTGKDDLAYLHQFILHSSLDLVDNAMWSNNAT